MTVSERYQELLEKSLINILQVAGQSVLIIGDVSEEIVSHLSHLGGVVTAHRGDPLEDLVKQHGIFDVVIAHDVVHTTAYGLLAFERAAAASRGILLVTSCIVDAANDAPFAALTPDSVQDAFAGAVTLPNAAWLRAAAKRSSFTVLRENRWSSQFDSLRLSMLCSRVSDKRAPIDLETITVDSRALEKTAVVVLSCSRFEQAWMPFFTLFKRYWADCPFNVYLGTDSGSFPGTQSISLGSDHGWATNARMILEKIDAEYVILFQEDFLIQKPVNGRQVERLVTYAATDSVGCLRLMPLPGPSRPWPRAPLLGAINATDAYRLSLQLAVWNKRVLLSLLNDGETPWQTEEYGTARAALSEAPFLSLFPNTPLPVDYYVTGIVQGIWQDGALELLKKEGIDLSLITKEIPGRVKR